MEQKIMVVMFLDVRGFSGLRSAPHVRAFAEKMLPRVAQVMGEHKPAVVNTWGDAVFAAFTEPKAAARAALDLRDVFRDAPWEDYGLPSRLGARIALHFGPVLFAVDPVTNRPNVFGADVNLAARIEPVVDTDEVWVSDCGSDLLKAIQGHGSENPFRLDSVGSRKLPKGAGELRLYCLRRSRENEYVPAAVSRSSAFVKRFVDTEEPDMLASCPVSISFSRSYRLLLHMFRQETFHSFCAFDLAFRRWEELVNRGESQTLNVSDEIFRAIEDMVKCGRCGSFRRILVVSQKSLGTPLAKRVIEYVHSAEVGWNLLNKGVHVETRLFEYPLLSSDQRLIHDLCDFALFRKSDDESLAIIETELKSVHIVTDPLLTKMCIDTSPATSKRLSEGFEIHWAKSAPLTAWIQGQVGDKRAEKPK